MKNLSLSLLPALALTIFFVGCSAPTAENCMELTLTATSPRCTEYFDFGTGDYSLKVDNKGLLIRQADGTMKPIQPIMGEIHPNRVNEEDWSREIDKMKEGGINTIASYMFWAYQEPENGKFCWEGNLNIRKFVELCGQKGLYVVLRIGPWCHGECYLGGIPDWVAADSTIHTRTTDPKYMALVTRYYNEIGKQVKGLFGGTSEAPIIGVQLENECGGDSWPYMMELKKAALNAGICPPFFTRTGWPAVKNATFGEMLPLYGDYADGFWDRENTDMPGGYPDAFTFRSSRLSNVIATEVFGKNQSRQMQQGDLSYPYFTCELGGGMMTSYMRRIRIFNHDAIALAVCKVGSGSNMPGYYMYHGGTHAFNPKHSMAEMTESPSTNWNDLPYRSYDFQAPVGEMGQINDSYYELRRLHSFLRVWGPELQNWDPIFPATNTEDGRKDSTLRYTVRTDGMKGFVFVNNYSRLMPMSVKRGVQWKLHRTDGTTLTFPEKPINIGDSVVCWLPFGIDCDGVTLDWATAMPYDQNEAHYLLSEIPGIPATLSLDGTLHEMKAGESVTVKNKEGKEITFKLLSNAESLKPLPQYTLHEDKDAQVSAKQTKETTGIRDMHYVPQGVAAQPRNDEFDAAAVWSIDLQNVANPETAILEVNYKGDVARLYADGQLVEDNFWNGRPMLVRVRDIIGKQLELKILPMGKNYPIYLQPDQRETLKNCTGSWMLELEGVRVLNF